MVVLTMYNPCPLPKEGTKAATNIMDGKLKHNPAFRLREVEGDTQAAILMHRRQGEGDGRTEDHGGLLLVEDDIVLAGVHHGTGEVVQEARS